ncbi:glycosyltransferase family 4 protein [Croceicoccus bisphenolivorans]|uniref:glycosyltransferase family 4 protein n=1 Tax=Croceicoccus bisphenolivorans TaxID=1783232 RepID=UPI0008361709|nr:glycosyltransferase family 4 protein [Croceicoccus bisphenolivorans]
MNPKIAMLARYSRNGASSRLRFLQYEPALAAAGMEPAFEPFFGPEYLAALYDGRARRMQIVASYARRLALLRRRPSPDLLWIQSEAFPWLPAICERAALTGAAPYAIDCDDAIFHRYDLHRSAAVRAMLGAKIDRLMAGAAIVTAGNPYLAERALRAGARCVEIVPTVVDLDHYAVGERAGSDRPPAIGWIGTPSTWREYMVPLMPALLEIAAGHGARIRTVGAEPLAHPLVDAFAWTEASEVRRIQEMDIGIMPISDTPWSRGKCGYKLIQYMACGLPVVASPVGVNADIVEHGVNGFLATTPDEWRSAIGTLLDDEDLRRRMGNAGRAKVERAYSLAVWGPRVAGMLRQAVRH